MNQNNFMREKVSFVVAELVGYIHKKGILNKVVMNGTKYLGKGPRGW